MLKMWDEMTFEHVDNFFFTTYLPLLNEITILVNSYVHLGQPQASVHPWMSVAPYIFLCGPFIFEAHHSNFCFSPVSIL